MRILRSIVAPSTALMAFCDSKIMGCGSIRPQFIRDEVVWNKAVFLQQLAHEFQRRPLVPLWTSKSRNHGPRPQRRRRATDDHAAIDSPIDFVEMPNRMGLGSAFAQVRRDLGSKLAQPAPEGLVGARDSAFRQ
jgi:hypothetical protein